MIRAAAVLALLCCGTLNAQPLISLEQAAERIAGDWSPSRAGAEFRVQGTVAAGPIPVLDYAHLAIQDAAGHGLVLDAPAPQLQDLKPGDRIEAVGKIAHRAGLPVLHPSFVRVLAAGQPPAPQDASIADLRSFPFLGRWIVTEGVVSISSANQGGEYLRISDGRNGIQVFLPFLASPDGGLSRFRQGDRVRVTGISSMYSPLPPYNRSYQVMIDSPDRVVLLQRAGLFPAWFVVATLGAGLLVLILWWSRERRLAAHPRKLRRLYNLGEGLLSARTPDQSLSLLLDSLPELLGVTSVRAYLHNPASSALQIAGRGETEPPISLARPKGFRQRAAALCFRNRSLIAIPDSRKSPLFEPGETAPRSALYAPMLVRGQPCGVLEIASESEIRQFNDDEQAVVQHLANQFAINMRLVEREMLRDHKAGAEQCEALAHVARLLVRQASGLAERLTRMAASSEWRAGQPALPEDHQETVRRAIELSSRLQKLAAPLEGMDRAADLASHLRSVTERRKEIWRREGIRFEEQIASGEFPVSRALPAYLEELLESLFMNAERVLQPAHSRSLRVRLTRLAETAHLELQLESAEPSLSLADPRAPAGDSEGGELSLAVCARLARSWGGDLRWVDDTPMAPRFELELPLAPAMLENRAAQVLPAAARRALTVLLLDPGCPPEDSLLPHLGRAGHRCIAASSPEHAIELLQRLPFDALFCRQQLVGLTWQDVLESCRGRGVLFVLLTRGGLTLSTSPAELPGYSLAWPGAPEELHRVLEELQACLSSADRYNEE